MKESIGKVFSFASKLSDPSGKEKPAIFAITAFSAVTIIFLFFNIRMDVGGDDSFYIIAARRFMEGQSFPSWHSSLYPIFLSFFLWLFGYDLYVLKITSAIIVIIHFVLFYLAFSKRVPPVVLYFGLLVIAFSSHIAYYASTTYSEPLFMCLQMGTILFVFRLDDLAARSQKLNIIWKDLLPAVVFMFLLSITRNIGTGIIIAVPLYFLLRKKYLLTIYTTAFFIAARILYWLYKYIFWGIAGSEFGDQWQHIAYKNFYNHALGTENIVGFLQRFWENSTLYLSKHLTMMLGMHPPDSPQVSLVITIIFYLVFIAGLIISYRKYKPLMFTGIYLGIMIGSTFFSQQVHWDQERLIMVYLPLITIYLGVIIYEFFHIRWIRRIRFFVPIIFLLLIGMILADTISRVDIAALKKSLKGDLYFGFTPDWQNYLKMSEWAGENLPQEDVILCRKAEMSEIYGKRKFKGISRVPWTHPDSIGQYLNKNHITHIILANLRLNININNGQTVNTIRRLLYYYLQTHPADFRIVHRIGDNEPAFLLKFTKRTHLEDQEFVEAMNAAIVIMPDDPIYYLQAGNKLMGMGYFKDASLYYTTLIERGDQSPEPYFELGVACYYLNDLQQSIASFLKTIELYPEYGKAWYNLGVCYLTIGNEKTASEMFHKAKSLGYTGEFSSSY